MSFAPVAALLRQQARTSQKDDMKPMSFCTMAWHYLAKEKATGQKRFLSCMRSRRSRWYIAFVCL